MTNHPEGLCDRCVHHRVIRSGRGSEFLMCGRAKDDRGYMKYPPLPVFRCAGFEESDGGAPPEPSS